MDQVEPMAESSATAFQKIGRNVFALQQIEGLLKNLVSFSDINCGARDLPEHVKQQQASVAKKTLGLVAGEYFEQLHSEDGPPELPEGRVGNWFTLSYRPGSGGGDLGTLRQEVGMLVSERNDLIHHRLLSFNPTSEEACQTLIAFLDEQFQRMKPVLIRLHSERQELIDILTLLDDLKKQAKDNDARANPDSP